MKKTQKMIKSKSTKLQCELCGAFSYKPKANETSGVCNGCIRAMKPFWKTKN